MAKLSVYSVFVERIVLESVSTTTLMQKLDSYPLVRQTNTFIELTFVFVEYPWPMESPTEERGNIRKTVDLVRVQVQVQVHADRWWIWTKAYNAKGRIIWHV